MQLRNQHPGLFRVVVAISVLFVLHGQHLLFGDGQMVASPAYVVIDRVAPVRLWGAAFLVVGVVELVAFLTNREWWRAMAVIGTALAGGWWIALVLAGLFDDALKGSPWLIATAAVMQFSVSREPPTNPAAGRG